MTLAEFHNGLRVLTSIDMHELERAGVIGTDDHTAWSEFRSDPYRNFLRSGDARLEKLWTLMQSRMGKGRAAA